MCPRYFHVYSHSRFTLILFSTFRRKEGRQTDMMSSFCLILGIFWKETKIDCNLSEVPIESRQYRQFLLPLKCTNQHIDCAGIVENTCFNKTLVLRQ